MRPCLNGVRLSGLLGEELRKGRPWSFDSLLRWGSLRIHPLDELILLADNLLAHDDRLIFVLITGCLSDSFIPAWLLLLGPCSATNMTPLN